MDIKGFEDYQIDKEGNVFSKKRDKFLKPVVSNTGYLQLGLYKDGKSICSHIHRLIALQFIDNPDNLRCVDHIDRNKLNNSLNNLRWVTHSQNARNINCKGYCWNKQNKKYKAQYRLNGKDIHIGVYETPQEAREAYLEAIKNF